MDVCRVKGFRPSFCVLFPPVFSSTFRTACKEIVLHAVLMGLYHGSITILNRWGLALLGAPLGSGFVKV